MNLSQLRSLVRRKANDTVSPYKWETVFINAALNRACREACERALLLPADITISLVGSTASYSLPATTIIVDRVTLSNVPLTKTTREELDLDFSTWDDDTGTPAYYLQDGYTLQVFPIPTGSGTLKLKVFKKPTADMSADSDSPEIPAEYHEALTDFALHECFMCVKPELHNPELAARYLAAFEATFGQKKDAELLSMQKSRSGGAADFHTGRLK